MKFTFILVLSFLSATFSACGPSGETIKLMGEAKDLFGPIPDKMPNAENDTEARIELGRKLYFETALSVDDTISCNNCHNVLEKGSGTDNLPTSTGVKKQKGGRNSPTVWNAGFHIAQFWDGRSKDLQDQAKGPILNPIEMAMPDEASVIKKIQRIKEYEMLFIKAFPQNKAPMTYDNLAEAIAAFERTLLTKDRFDDFVNGDQNALNREEQEGLRLFVDTGCASCHNGPIFGGNSYKKMGIVEPYSTKDFGRYQITKKEEDKYYFKVPSLRNIAVTNPYFHDGSVNSLDDAVKKMAWHQLGKKLSDEKSKKIVAFLKTLTGKSL